MGGEMGGVFEPCYCVQTCFVSSIWVGKTAFPVRVLSVPRSNVSYTIFVARFIGLYWSVLKC